MNIDFRDALLGFVLFYPLTMAYVWMQGGLVFALLYERAKRQPDPLRMLSSFPLVSVIVPCYNESRQIEEVIAQLMRSRYPNFEVIAINDGSSDATAPILDGLTLTYPRLRVIHNAQNQGKGVGLNTAAVLARGEFIFGIDGDALIDEDAIAWLLLSMQSDPRVGAVTGNPRIRNRTSILGRMQVGEFSATIGLIKRTQQLWGALFTVSGVVALFRRRALFDAGLWATDILTEDIDISWRLQRAGWRIRFQPAALAWILMPETIRGLWKQRLRWAIGGVQAIMRHRSVLLSLRQRLLWPVYFEYVCSVVWAYAMAVVMFISVLSWAFPSWLPPRWHIPVLPDWIGVSLGVTCLLQMSVGMWIDRHYDRNLLRYVAWTLWYPIAFWAINMLTTVYAVPKALLWRSGTRAVWVSPDRGLGTDVRRIG